MRKWILVIMVIVGIFFASNAFGFTRPEIEKDISHRLINEIYHAANEIGLDPSMQLPDILELGHAYLIYEMNTNQSMKQTLMTEIETNGNLKGTISFDKLNEEIRHMTRGCKIPAVLFPALRYTVKIENEKLNIVYETLGCTGLSWTTTMKCKERKTNNPVNFVYAKCNYFGHKFLKYGKD